MCPGDKVPHDASLLTTLTPTLQFHERTGESERILCWKQEAGRLLPWSMVHAPWWSRVMVEVERRVVQNAFKRVTFGVLLDMILKRKVWK